MAYLASIPVHLLPNLLPYPPPFLSSPQLAQTPPETMSSLQAATPTMSAMSTPLLSTPLLATSTSQNSPEAMLSNGLQQTPTASTSPRIHHSTFTAGPDASRTTTFATSHHGHRLVQSPTTIYLALFFWHHGCRFLGAMLLASMDSTAWRATILIPHVYLRRDREVLAKHNK